MGENHAACSSSKFQTAWNLEEVGRGPELSGESNLLHARVILKRLPYLLFFSRYEVPINPDDDE
jgi:hypothetical protein